MSTRQRSGKLRRRIRRFAPRIVAAAALLVAEVRAPAAAAEKPAAGMFLIAGRDLEDPNFARTVVLLFDYGPRGAAGVIVNRPTETRLKDLLPEVEGLASHPDVVYQGGPVAVEAMVVLLRSGAAVDDAESVFEDVWVGSGRELLERVARGGGEFRIFAGHAGWAPGQLDWEISLGGWTLLPADAEAVFDDAPQELWRRLERAASSPVARAPLPPAGAVKEAAPSAS